MLQILDEVLSTPEAQGRMRAAMEAEMTTQEGALKVMRELVMPLLPKEIVSKELDAETRAPVRITFTEESVPTHSAEDDNDGGEPDPGSETDNERSDNNQ